MTTYSDYILGALLAEAAVLKAVRAESIISVRELASRFEDREAFAAAVRHLCATRQIIGYCDREVSAMLSNEHVDGICVLASMQ